eukprot:112841_1
MDLQLNLSVNKTKQTLVYGYLRINYHQRLPNDIIKLIFKLYNEVIIWNVDNQALQQFLLGEKLFLDHFIVDGLVFKCALIPGKNAQCSFQLLSNKNMSKVVAYFYMNIIQPDIFWKGPMIFDGNTIVTDKYNDKSDNDAEIWWMFNIPLVIPLVDFKDYNRLDLSVWPQILSIQYHENNDNISNYNLNIKIRKNTNFVWKINKSDLVKFPDYQPGKAFFSQNFPSESDDYFNWSACIVPDAGHDSVALVLEIVRLPQNIKYIDVDWKISSHENNILYGGHKAFSYENFWMMKPVEPTKLTHDSFKNLHELEFIIQIDITSIVDWNDNIMDEQN